MNKKQKAEYIYNYILKNITRKFLGNKSTYTDDLNIFCKKLFNDKFMGVYPADKIKKLTNKKPYMILNLDKSGMSGSHWVAVVKNNNKTLFYDSFGRSYKKIMPNIKKSNNKKIYNTELDKEQENEEKDCGARCCAFLCVVDWFGIDYGELI